MDSVNRSKCKENNAKLNRIAISMFVTHVGDMLVYLSENFEMLMTDSLH